MTLKRSKVRLSTRLRSWDFSLVPALHTIREFVLMQYRVSSCNIEFVVCVITQPIASQLDGLMCMDSPSTTQTSWFVIGRSFTSQELRRSNAVVSRVTLREYSTLLIWLLTITISLLTRSSLSQKGEVRKKNFRAFHFLKMDDTRGSLLKPVKQLSFPESPCKCKSSACQSHQNYSKKKAAEQGENTLNMDLGCGAIHCRCTNELSCNSPSWWFASKPWLLSQTSRGP